MFKHILVAYDGSEHAKNALDKAVQMAEKSDGCKLTAIHVFQLNHYLMGESMIGPTVAASVNWYEQAENIVAEAKEKVKHLNGESVLLQGYPAHQIIEYAKNHGCDLIIVGSRGLGPVRQFFLGSVSHNIVQQAEIPVLVMK